MYCSCRKDCSNKTCTCRKSGITCTILCKNCKGEDCSNARISKSQLIDDETAFENSCWIEKSMENQLEADDDLTLLQDSTNCFEFNETLDSLDVA